MRSREAAAASTLLSSVQVYLERKNTKVRNYFFDKKFVHLIVFLGFSDWNI